MTIFPQNHDQWNDANELAATMNEVIGLLDGAAASGVPAVVENRDLRALGLLEDRSTTQAPLDNDLPSAALRLLARAHGCEMSGPYWGDGMYMGAYYLFQRAKAA